MLVFIVLVALAATLVSGILPAVQSARLDVSGILKDESHAASSFRVGRLSKMIVAVEIAIAAALLVGTGFLTRSIVNIRTIEPGFTRAGVFTASVSLSGRDTVRHPRFFEDPERELAAVPGATGVYVGGGLPGTRMRADRARSTGAPTRTRRTIRWHASSR